MGDMIMFHRSVATLLLATVPLTVGALSATASATTPAPKVIRTVPGATVGGLPVITNDRKIEVLPQAPKSSATAAGHVARRAGGPWQTGATGYDISWPQCPAHNAVMPPPSTVAIVGINDGTPFTTLPCMQEELDWASKAPPRSTSR